MSHRMFDTVALRLNSVFAFYRKSFFCTPSQKSKTLPVFDGKARNHFFAAVREKDRAASGISRVQRNALLPLDDFYAYHAKSRNPV